MELIRRCAAWRPDSHQAGDPVVATRIALQKLARRYLQLDEEINDSDALLEGMVTEVAPQLIAVAGIGPETAGQILVTIGDNPERVHSEAAFAMLCGVAPLPASSGKPSGTGSTAAETGKPTGPSTSSRPPGNAATRAPRPI